MTVRTVTLSPGFDHLVAVQDLRPGEVGRVVQWRVVASGKGVNVARALATLDVRSVAYTLAGAEDEAEFVDLITGAGVVAVSVPVPGSIRRNLTLSREGSGDLAAHATGPRLAGARDAHADELVARLVADVRDGDVVTLNGAVPGTIRDSVWEEAATAVHAKGATVVADVQGMALVQLLSSGVVWAAKPNEDEALALVRLSRGGADGNVTRALSEMEAMGVVHPMVSLGERGLVHLVDGVPVQSRCHVERPAVVVGAGDAFVAGFCAALVADEWREAPPTTAGLAAAAAHVAGVPDAHFAGTARSLCSSVTHQPWTS